MLRQKATPDLPEAFGWERSWSTATIGMGEESSGFRISLQFPHPTLSLPCIPTSHPFPVPPKVREAPSGRKDFTLEGALKSAGLISIPRQTPGNDYKIG